MAKRKYTVSEKVLAASRRNLEKANAVPKSIRYRTTPKRLAASRQNLLKARAGRRGAGWWPRKRPFSARHLGRGLRRWGKWVRARFQADQAAVMRVLAPQPETPSEGKLARGVAEGLWRWVAVLRDGMEREREGLRQVWVAPATDALAAAALAWRLLAVFSERQWMGEARERLQVRLARLARMFYEIRNLVRSDWQEEIEAMPASLLGNPFHPIPKGLMADLLSEPAPELKLILRLSPPLTITLPELPAENPGPAAWSPARRERPEGVEDSSAPVTAPDGGRKADSIPEWPEDFATYERMVMGALGGSAELKGLVERIARLSWKRARLFEQDWKRAQKELQEWLEEQEDVCLPASLLMKELEPVFDAERWQAAQAEAEKLEAELAVALKEYLARRYGAHPAFELVTPARKDERRSEGEGADREEPEDGEMRVGEWKTEDEKWHRKDPN